MKNYLKFLVCGAMLSALMVSSVQPQVMTGWRIVTAASWGFDSTNYPPDSQICYYAGGVFGGDADSMRRVTTAFNELEGWSKPDTLSAYANITTANIGDVAINPSCLCLWYLPDGQILRDNSPQITMMIRRVDSLEETLFAAGFGPNEDTILIIDTAGGGRVVVEGAVFFVRSEPGGTPETTERTSDATGRNVVNLAAADWEVIVNTPLYFQENLGQVITNTTDQLDSIFIYSITIVAIPSSGDSTMVMIFTDVPYAEAKITLHGLNRDDASKPIRLTAGTWIDRNEVRPRPKADVNGIIQVILVRSGKTTPTSAYDIQVMNRHNKEVMKVENYAVPDQPVDTLLNDQ